MKLNLGIRASADCPAGSTRAGLSALILGATGATGKVLLQELLASPTFSSVSEYGRHVTEQEKLASAAGKEKLEQKVIDFERLEEAGLKEGKWDVVFVTCVPLRWQGNKISDAEAKLWQPRNHPTESGQCGGVRED